MKPVPEMVGALMVRGRFPVELKVRVFVVGTFAPRLPNATVVALGVRMRVAGSNWSVRLLEIPPSVAVSAMDAAV